MFLISNKLEFAEKIDREPHYDKPKYLDKIQPLWGAPNLFKPPALPEVHVTLTHKLCMLCNYLPNVF